MSFWDRRSSGYVYVYRYCPKKRQQVALPRKETKHLDKLTNQEIDAYVNGLSNRRRALPVADSQIMQDLEGFCDYMQSRQLDPATISQHRSLLLRFVLPFFVGLHPNDWAGISIKLLAHLQKQEGITPTMIFRCNVALRKFYKWLSEEGKVRSGYDIKLRTPVLAQQDTPLKRVFTPEEVLAWVNESKADNSIKLIALLGYFFSLRPQEIFAAMPKHFKAGAGVTELECSKAFRIIEITEKKEKLFDRFVVHAQEQRTNGGRIVVCKKHSKGWVSCFSKDAAVKTIEILKTLHADKKIAPYCNREMYERWKEHGMDCTIKDLRRSSLYWLGHYTTIQPFQLQKHARHKRIEATMKYLRRPEDKVSELVGLDLDFVNSESHPET